jgi:hypothetical protein
MSFLTAINQESGAYGDERAAAGHAAAFDPFAAVQQSAQGAFNSFRNRLSKQIAALRGNQVGMGRMMDSGWAQQDEDELVTEGIEGLNNEIMRNSTAAAGMDMQNRQFGASQAQERTGRYYDLMAGQRDAEIGQSNAKRGSRDNLISAGMGLAGNILGGPIGGKIGGFLGGLLKR